MRENKEHDEYKQPSGGETFLGLMLVVAVALAIWLFVDQAKDFRVDTVFRVIDRYDSLEPTEPVVPEG